MARTQLDERGLQNRILTGASFIPGIGIWDETQNYTTNTKVFWNTKVYNCILGTIGTTEGDLTNTPDIDIIHWTEFVVSTPPNTYADCVNSTLQTFNNTEVKISLSTATSTADTTINITTNTVTLNTTGRYRISYKINMEDATTQRLNPVTYLKINNAQLAISKVYSYNRNTADGKSTTNFTMTRVFAAGDTVDFFAINNSTQNMNILASESYFEFEYISNI